MQKAKLYTIGEEYHAVCGETITMFKHRGFGSDLLHTNTGEALLVNFKTDRIEFLVSEIRRNHVDHNGNVTVEREFVAMTDDLKEIATILLYPELDRKISKIEQSVKFYTGEYDKLVATVGKFESAPWYKRIMIALKGKL